jgi:sec-independent protein translocase protein TatB
MELLGIGPLELIVIIILALVVFSPKDIAGGGKAVGRWINRLYRSETYRSMKQVSQELQDLPSRLAREANLDELKDLEKEVKTAGETPRAEAPSTPAVPGAEKPNQQEEDATKPDPRAALRPAVPVVEKPNQQEEDDTKPDPAAAEPPVKNDPENE